MLQLFEEKKNSLIFYIPPNRATFFHGNDTLSTVIFELFYFHSYILYCCQNSYVLFNEIKGNKKQLQMILIELFDIHYLTGIFSKKKAKDSN